MGDDYRYHFEADAKRRFLQLLKDRFNSPTQYKGKMWQWDTIILSKTEELGRFLIGKSHSLDFTEPKPSLMRIDNLKFRKQILELSQKQARELGIGKSTLHYLRENARDNHSFKVYGKVLPKLIGNSDHTIDHGCER